MIRKAGLSFLLLPVLSGCIPRIEVTTPKEPIAININVRVEHDIHIKADGNIEKLLQTQRK